MAFPDSQALLSSEIWFVFALCTRDQNEYADLRWNIKRGLGGGMGFRLTVLYPWGSRGGKIVMVSTP